MTQRLTMQRSQLLYDGLWRCLCPAFDRNTLHRAVHQQSLGLLRSPLRRPAKLPRPSTTCAKLIQNRQHGTSAAAVDAVEAVEQTEQHEAESAKPVSWKQRLLTPTPPNEEALQASSIDEITAALLALRDPKRWKSSSENVDQHERIVQLAQHLLASRDQPLSPFIYECMMDTMADPKGSVDGVRRLLDDMATQGMKPTAELCHAALGALMNHPDYVLRQEVVDIMQEYWFAIDTPVKQSVVIGLLRDEQYELAYTRLTEMIDQGARIDLWVYDIFILVFGKLGFLDEMLLLLHRRKRGREADPVVNSLLYYVLDVCSQAYHHTGTAFGWNCLVRNSLMQPSDGIVENVLGTAARHADTQLATEALDLISSRTRAQSHHYEAVVEAFAADGDVAPAFRILCIMRENGIRIKRGHTRVMLKTMKNRPELVTEAEKVVRDMTGNQAVPQAVVGVVIEAMIQIHGSERAMELYHDIPALCNGDLPNARLVQDLIIHSANLATAQNLTREYHVRFSDNDDPKRSLSTLSTLITRCAEIGEMDLAFRFAKQVMATGVAKRRPSMKWITTLVAQAVEREDGRVWPVVDELSKADDGETSKMVQRILQQKKIAKRAAERKATPQG